MPHATANPTCCRIEFPARTSDPNVPARISPADPIAGPACRTASAARQRRTCSLTAHRGVLLGNSLAADARNEYIQHTVAFPRAAQRSVAAGDPAGVHLRLTCPVAGQRRVRMP
jgi:hypothetical protein